MNTQRRLMIFGALSALLAMTTGCPIGNDFDGNPGFGGVFPSPGSDAGLDGAGADTPPADAPDPLNCAEWAQGAPIVGSVTATGAGAIVTLTLPGAKWGGAQISGPQGVQVLDLFVPGINAEPRVVVEVLWLSPGVWTEPRNFILSGTVLNATNACAFARRFMIIGTPPGLTLQ